MCEDDTAPHPIAALNIDMVKAILQSQPKFARRDMLGKATLHGDGSGDEKAVRKGSRKRRRQRSPSTERPSTKRKKKININS